MSMDTSTSPSSRLRGTLHRLASAVLLRNIFGATIRLALVGGAVAIYWFAVARAAGFPPVLPEAWLSGLPFPLDVLLDVGTSFFEPSILLRVIPILAGLWLGFQVGSHYLRDIFELESSSIAARYLGAALFGVGNQRLEIISSNLEELDLSNPVLRVGGPGHLTVHLGFAAVLESIDGIPVVYSSTDDRFLDGFERLRDVVDLRDQSQRVDEIHTLTRDGVDVFARDAQMMFRVYGGGRTRALEDPYPYVDEAVRRLVYGQPVSANGKGNWSENLSRLVRQEIQTFVAGLTIHEFLALEPRQILDEGSEDNELDEPELPASIHIPRIQLTERFHNSATKRRLRDLGLELAWVGVGTWEIRDQPSSALYPGAGATIIGTWRDLQRSRLYSTPEYLNRQRKLGFRSYAGGVLRGLVSIWNEQAGDEQARCWLMVSDFRGKLEAIRQSLTADPEGQVPLDFEKALQHYRQLAQHEIL